MLEGAAELVRAGGRLRATADAVELSDDIINMLATNEAADALQIAVASTQEKHLLDDVILVGSDINQLRASPLRLVLYVLGFHRVMRFIGISY